MFAFALPRKNNYESSPFAVFSGIAQWRLNTGKLRRWEKSPYLSNPFHRFQFKSMLLVLFHGDICVDYESCEYCVWLENNFLKSF